MILGPLITMPTDASLLTGNSLESGVQIGDFRIERRLGAGGMGIVYQARQLSLNRPVALKVLGQALTRDTDVSRFQREAHAAARLRHPAIAQVYFIGQDQHLCFLAMELVEGISLRKALDRLGTATSIQSGIDSAVQEDLEGEPKARQVRFDVPTEGLESPRGGDEKPKLEKPKPEVIRVEDPNPYLSPKAIELRTSTVHVRRCCEIARDAARALAHAHEQGVVHRDIKPDNLLLDRKGGLHLIDFGVARFFDDQAITTTGQLVGTPLYMSPEQVTGRGTLDARTDIYSLGLVLYELLTLRPAVEATNRENLLRSIVTKPLVPVSWRNSAVTNQLERVVHRATQKDPDERYASAAEFADELDRYLAGKPVNAPVYRFRLDEREITASRPGGVMLAAFIFIMVASMLFLTFASVAVMTGVITANWSGAIIGAIQALVGLAALIVGVAVGWGLLAGRTWARWTGIVLAMLLSLSSLMLIFLLGWFAIWSSGSADFAKAMEGQQEINAPAEKAQQPGADVQSDGNIGTFDPRRFIYGMVGMYMLPGLFGLLLGIAALWSLLTHESAAWFRLAKSIRDEHRLLRHELG
jgi:serine/threonine protein kinase